MPATFIIADHEGSSVQHKAALLSDVPGACQLVPFLLGTDNSGSAQHGSAPPRRQEGELAARRLQSGF